jgi:hypothetical protein
MAGNGAQPSWSRRTQKHLPAPLLGNTFSASEFLKRKKLEVKANGMDESTRRIIAAI